VARGHNDDGDADDHGVSDPGTDAGDGEEFDYRLGVQGGWLRGGSMIAINTSKNQLGATIGTFPTSKATFVSGTFRGKGDTGFIVATTPISTQEPPTRDLYIFNTNTAGSLTRVTNNL
jgi:hypothetical protein